MKQALLSICIPIYNRANYLELMLARFMEDVDLFNEKIDLFISDNCSEEDLHAIVQDYAARGLNIRYHRNEVNTGGDANICACFRAGQGDYTWVLGSDDIPVSGVLRDVVSLLETYSPGILHLNHYDKRKQEIVVYSDPNDFFVDMHVWITFITANILRTVFIEGYDFEHYVSTSLAQVPLFLKAAFGSDRNVNLNRRYLEDYHDSITGGGYNVFEVYAVNLLSMFQTMVQEGQLSEKAYRRIKRSIYREFLAENILNLLVLRRESRNKKDSGWKIIREWYGFKPYVLTDFIHVTCKFGSRRVVKDTKKFITKVCNTLRPDVAEDS